MTAEAPRSDHVAVLLPLPLAGAYDYRAPDGMGLEPGDFVRVPLGGRDVTGVVWGAANGGVDEARLRAVADRLEVPRLPSAALRFVEWVANYTLSSPGSVLRMVMSVPAALAPAATLTAYALAPGAGPDARITPARRRVLEVLAGSPPLIAADLAREAHVGTSVVKGLHGAGLLQALPLRADPPVPEPDWRRSGVTLSPGQQDAAAALRGAVAAGRFSVTVLDGVPGSGKTEVYFEAVAEALERGRQALVLLPEIALSAQWLVRFRNRFGCEPLEWHSDLPASRRRATWRAVAEGRAKVVVGARSALFLPYSDLGLIVVDEEHDASYKQEDGVLYNARDMAVVRGRLGGIAVALVSATPSLETIGNARAGRYGLVEIPSRTAHAVLPEVSVIDLRKEALPATRWIAEPLRRALDETLRAGEQGLLFLNRRGYAPLTLCRRCGHRLQCPHCSAWLVEHRLAADAARLQCHHCGFSMREPSACPSCLAEQPFAACGPGVERLAEEVAATFPNARLAVAASDTLTGPKAADELVRRIEAREVDVIVGTQIVAKGYHFPMLTLVGVVDADLGLAGGDLRAAERTFQLLYQVAGRAGRGERPGRVLLQTTMPEHPVMGAIAAADRAAFLEAEAEGRRDSAAPPFGRWVALIVSAPDEDAADQAARALARSAPHGHGVAVLGPAPAPLALLRGQHRRRLLLKAPLEVRVQPLVTAWLRRTKLPSKARVKVDVDPYSFL